MHHLLKHQLRKSKIFIDTLQDIKLLQLLHLVEQAYNDNDSDRKFLEHAMEVSSNEMQELYKTLAENSKSALAQSERKYRNLIDNLKDYYIFYSRSKEGKLTYVSQSVTNILGYLPDDFNEFSKYLTDNAINENLVVYTEQALMGY